MLEQHLPGRTRQHRQRRHRRRKPVVFALCFVATVIAVFATAGIGIVLRRGITPPGPHSAPATSPEKAQAPKIEFASALPPTTPTRAVYKYSVIEGGAHSPNELAAAIERDPVVAGHYRAIHAERVRTETVDADRAVYVSYRRGDKIYWTSHKVTLRQGETILTDGSTQVRSRCGNCISLQPMLPTAEDEPDVAELDALVAAPVSGGAKDSAGPIAPPFKVEDVIAGGLLGAGPAAAGPFGSFGGNLGGTLLGDEAASGSGGGSSGAINQVNPGGIIPRFPVPPPAGDIPSPGDLPGPGDVPGNPPADIPPVVLVNLPPPFGPPLDTPDTPGDFPTNNLPPDTPTTPVPTPEPGTMLLVGGGLAALLRNTRSRSRVRGKG